MSEDQINILRDDINVLRNDMRKISERLDGMDERLDGMDERLDEVAREVKRNMHPSWRHFGLAILGWSDIIVEVVS